jgi:hypothetical protein
MRSCWCFAEITQAKALGKEIFPAKIGPCEPISILSALHIIDLTAGDEGYKRLWRGLEVAGLDPNDDFDWDRRRSPYPGLNHFEEVDAGIYFGRELEIKETLDALNRMRRHREPRMMIIVGASGSGKSSLVRAGVIPRLNKDPDRWLIVPPFRPGQKPFTELALALKRKFGANLPEDWQAIRDQLLAGGSVRMTGFVRTLMVSDKSVPFLVVVDQFEELFALDGRPEAGSRAVSIEVEIFLWAC